MVNKLVELFILVPFETYTILLLCDFLQFRKLNFKKNILAIYVMSILNFLLQLLPEASNNSIISFTLMTSDPIIGSYVYYKISKIYQFKLCIIATFISIICSVLCLLLLNIIFNGNFYELMQTKLSIYVLFNIIYRIILIFILFTITKRCV